MPVRFLLEQKGQNMPPVFYEMKNSVIGIAGLGGLGSNVAVALARVGAGKLIITDFDVVEESNLSRQHYFLDQIGRAKVEATAENISRINPDTKIQMHRVRLTPENIPMIFAEADVVAECFDLAEQKQMLVETVLSRMQRPVVVSVSGLAGYGNSNAIKTRRISPRHILVGDGETEARPGIRLTASRVGVAAYHQANAITEVIVNT
jgi:sulfur carrier protein ThiS adenylyltransferase